MISPIKDLLWSLPIDGRFAGYWYCTYALERALELGTLPSTILKDVAQHYERSPDTVCTAIRRVQKRAKTLKPLEYAQLMDGRPDTSKQFLAALFQRLKK